MGELTKLRKKIAKLNEKLIEERTKNKGLEKENRVISKNFSNHLKLLEKKL